MAVETPCVPGSARGTLAFVGAGRLQTPRPEPYWADQTVRLRFADGRVSDEDDDNEDAAILADWFAAADDVSADDLVVHSYDGGFMVGIGRPAIPQADGSLAPGNHLDLMLSKADVDLDGHPFIRNGSYTRQSGVR